MTAFIPKSKFTPELKTAIELYAKARHEGLKPPVHSVVEAAVKRIPGPQLSEADAMAVIEKHVAAAALPIAQHALANLVARKPAPARKTAGLWVKKKDKVQAAATKDDHANAVVQLEAAIVALKAGKVPVLFKHMLPARPPTMTEGRDSFVPDYQIVDDE